MSHSLPKIKFKRDFTKLFYTGFSPGHLSSCKEATNKTKQSRTKQSKPTNQPNKRPNNQTTKRSTNHQTANQQNKFNKPTQTKRKQERNKPNKSTTKATLHKKEGQNHHVSQATVHDIQPARQEDSNEKVQAHQGNFFTQLAIIEGSEKCQYKQYYSSEAESFGFRFECSISILEQKFGMFI